MFYSPAKTGHKARFFPHGGIDNPNAFVFNGCVILRTSVEIMEKMRKNFALFTRKW